jgi:hypothetical protein
MSRAAEALAADLGHRVVAFPGGQAGWRNNSQSQDWKALANILISYPMLCRAGVSVRDDQAR